LTGIFGSPDHTVVEEDGDFVCFQLHPLKPDGSQLLTGVQKFEHLAKMARRSTPPQQPMRPSAFLDIEMRPEQGALLDPSPQDYVMQTIMSHAHGEGAKAKLAKRKLDCLGNLRGSSGLANDEERQRRLKNQLQLSSSLAAISSETQSENATKHSQVTSALVDLAPTALGKLTLKGGDASKLTMPELKALAFVKFDGTILKGDKAQHVREFDKLVAEQPGIICITPPAAPAPPVTLALAPPVTVALAPPGAPAPAEGMLQPVMSITAILPPVVPVMSITAILPPVVPGS
jgi:hypothetical protein